MTDKRVDGYLSAAQTALLIAGHLADKQTGRTIARISRDIQQLRDRIADREVQR